MPIYKPSELKNFLSSIKAAPQKRFSQNFLIDGNIVRKMIAFADIKEGETILEIGPGPGVLTQLLLQNGHSVVAIEKDRKLCQALHRFQTPDERLKVFEEDALKWDPAFHITSPAKIIANLPYHITTPLLTHFLPKYPLFSSMTLMVQKEFAERMLAGVGSSEYSSLSLFLQFYCTPKMGFIVEPTCFYPPPSIKSAVVQLILKEPPPVDPTAFFEVTRRAFQQRRKMVRTSLKEHYALTHIEEGLECIGKGLNVRPEELTLADFLTLFSKVHHHTR
ncbi:16S rRNA (adenine(1518)-N(6)/adenine(1519)-N(6))-dimethyltransferase RsmA [Rhabdochlamydiaceae symbiont of Dictyostelium giganteum]|uniref:16S rRNA (adenine(1518)-N(6)/adenine(1519)-N(6))- dimethyltransferase RsmA n=1 Tax=Rhabdochlamydiaceae symbiont of Dictyostelium giganteum TaxID=3342349 RepID=UPI00385175E3